VSPLAAIAVGAVTMAANFSGLQEVTHHIVRDERERDAAFVKFPGGEAGALKIGARFRHKDVDLFCPVRTRRDDAKRAADAAGGERAGVALRHDLAFAGHEFRAEAADGFVGSAFFEMNLLGFLDHSLPDSAQSEVSAVNSANRRLMRSRAQKRSTAVGRVFASVPQISVNSGARISTDVAGECRTPRAAPIAAATPMAGAPRMTISRMALATSRSVV